VGQALEINAPVGVYGESGNPGNPQVWVALPEKRRDGFTIVKVKTSGNRQDGKPTMLVKKHG
jgi:hypothetical protein